MKTITKRIALPLALCAALAAPLIAAEGGQGASEWSETNNNFCAHTSHTCTRWDGPNDPTSEQSFDCGDLYWFWSDQVVLSTCES